MSHVFAAVWLHFIFGNINHPPRIKRFAFSPIKESGARLARYTAPKRARGE